MKKILFCCILSTTLAASPIAAQTNSQKLAATAMHIWKDSFSLAGKPSRWMYDMGVLLKGMEGLWRNTGDATYFRYIQQLVDFLVDEEGVIKDYSIEEYNLDNVNSAKLLLLLYKVTTKEKYLKAARQVRLQLQSHPRTHEGGFWHKKIYPYQMWLDGLYMAGPFYAEYADLMHETADFDDIANQFIWVEKHTRDTKTGLLYHAWDESRQQQWCNKQTGTSAHFWSRAMGWYADALVDVLDWFPRDHPKRKSLIDILNRLVTALEKFQDPKTGVWLDILNYDGPGKERNYFEASASCQFVYAIAKGVRNGYLPQAKLAMAQKGYAGILKQFIKEENGQTNLYYTVKGSGLGGNPYRDGTFNYYMSEPLVVNEPKGTGAFLLASTEMERVPTMSIGRGKTVLLDRYFNSEKRKDAGGSLGYWHYVWNEYSHPGFAAWGHIFNSYGAKLASLDVAPTAAGLKNASVYIIVDPDHTKDNPNPNYVSEKDVAAIRQWVNGGGVLLLMANDSANCDLVHFNKLAEAFGLHFTNKSTNMVKNDVFEQGAVDPGEHNIVFPNTRKMYLKEISTIKLKFPAEAYVMKGADVLIAGRRMGKGLVVAVGDPWLYNEYLDGRKLPAEYDNFHAAGDLAKWLLTGGAGPK